MFSKENIYFIKPHLFKFLNSFNNIKKGKRNELM